MVAGKVSTPLIAIVGSTATGKTDLSISVAKKFNCEIISADSWLIRRHLNIGTAKPTPEQLSLIPHHMIDVVDPCNDYSAAKYKQDAVRAIELVYAKGKIPLVVGGTGLYVDSILYNYSFLPAPGPEIRQILNNMNLTQLHELAISKGLDLNTVDINNKRRVIRLIETDGMVATKSNLRPNTLIVGLSVGREQLKERIIVRVDSMLNAGLTHEVKNLADKYGWQCEGLKGIGYNEWELYFNDHQTIETTRERIIKDTYALAKRQQTWFKRHKSIHWFDTPVNSTDIDELITTYLSKHIFL